VHRFVAPSTQSEQQLYSKEVWCLPFSVVVRRSANVSSPDDGSLGHREFLILCGVLPHRILSWLGKAFVEAARLVSMPPWTCRGVDALLVDF